MPKKKKFAGVNEKVQQARDRRADTKEAKKSAASKAEEDSKWKDEGMSVKEKRAREAEQKKTAAAAKRAEKKALMDADEKTLVKKPKVAPKATVHQVRVARWRIV
jgi:hypothetical protein